jgi:hypothetical protein
VCIGLIVAVVLVAIAAAPVTDVAAADDGWASLRRPLLISRVAPGTPCPVTPARSLSRQFAPAQGNGPIYAVGASHGLGFLYPIRKSQVWYPSRWSGNKVLWVAPATFSGLVLVRGRRVDGPQALRFGNGSRPTGELHLTLTARDKGESGWLELPSYTRVWKPGCYAWQVDGADFSYVIVFRARRVR